MLGCLYTSYKFIIGPQHFSNVFHKRFYAYNNFARFKDEKATPCEKEIIYKPEFHEQKNT